MLPKLEMPVYEVELISTKKKVQFRPFLVKEQKLFLMNTEDSDPESVVKVIRQVLKNCLISDIDVDSLPVFDLEYLFMHMRARSVSEVVELKYRCNNTIKNETDGTEKVCNYVNNVSFNLLEIKPTLNPDHKKEFQINDKIGLIMKYPTFELLQKVSGLSENETIMELVYNSIDKVYDKENVYNLSDSSKEEIVDFVDNLQQKNLESIKSFFETMPTMKKIINYECKKCNYKEDITIEGIQNFFG